MAQHGRAPQHALLHDAHSTTATGRWSTRRIAVTSLFCALAFILTFVEIPIFPPAPWLKYDPSGIVALVAALAFGPGTGCVVVALPWALKTLFSFDIYGHLMAVLAGVALVVPAALVAQRAGGRRGLVAGMALGGTASLVAALAGNLVVTPLYTAVSVNAVMAMIVPILLPFNLLKVVINCVVTGLVQGPVAAVFAQGSPAGEKDQPLAVPRSTGGPAPAEATGTAAIRLSHVTLRYDDAPALNDVSLTVAPGERLCVLGANGSGKSTLASVMAGLLAPDEGTVELAGQRVCTDGTPDLDAYRAARRSLGLVFQNPDDQIVTSIVEDDVAFGPENLGLPRAEIAARVERELKRVALDAYATADPARLSGGQKQRVTIAGALAMEPAVLVLDEPASSLDVRGRAAILRVMGRLSAAGTTLVHVTHFMEEALKADRVIVLDRGRIALAGTPEDVFAAGAARLHELGLEMPFAATLALRLGLAPTASEKDLIAEVMASEMLETAAARRSQPFSPARPAKTAHPDAAPALSVEHVSFSYGPHAQALEDVSLAVAPGASVALVGQTGSGKSTLLRLLCGLEMPDSGSVTIAGHDTTTKEGRRAVRQAVGYVMQHPERQLFAETVEKDVAFGPRNLGLSPDEVERRVAAALELVGLSARRDASPFALSGGQRRLCALAGVLAMEPRILILDEPTAGLDPRGRALVRRVLAHLHEEGTTLVQVTHAMEDAARADTVVVLNQAHVVAAGTPLEVFSAQNEERLTAAGLGIPRALRLAREFERQGGCAPGSLGEPLTTDELVAALTGCATAATAAAPAPQGGER